ncbi:hypothetical protein [Nitratireductor sp. OM-1]|uniref:hypothetical protein n=1 Tax=Nitratireductor sp. OM-1 TaxID=1756988 RepID=UPI000DDE005D|nr:hypothetical protein [Nitratireductor sp. OM-1]
MAKQDHPTLEFVVERGRLSPADPYVAEVLDTYRNGDKLTVTLNQKRSLPLLKKYWVVLRDVVENAKTPWESANEASDALKLALGVTDISKTIKGQWFIRPGSISFASMDEGEFRPFFEKAMAALSEVTGIDPDALRKRYDHIPEHSSPAESPTGDGSGALVATNSDRSAAENSPATADEAGSQDMGESESEPASVDPDWLKTFAKAIIGAIGEDEVVVVNQSKGLFVEGLSDEVRAKAKSITNYARACCRNEIELDDCRATIAGVVGCEEKDLAA